MRNLYIACYKDNSKNGIKTTTNKKLLGNALTGIRFSYRENRRLHFKIRQYAKDKHITETQHKIGKEIIEVRYL